ncbi:OPT/YSL family transporter [Polycyclovorans algicola]|uniref:OPT/YSL family transporter n=1 Tax=Polycyclovorans algicola TaxID=616992 RepID=UPI0004A773FB|nr:OPT family oligopeptide transporter [Polycyclovorans algicola]
MTAPPANPVQPALTARALLTGAVLGALLTPCNVYSGLKIGWSFNMSIASALLAVAFWRLMQDLAGARHWGLPENIINQTTASSSASIVSGGLVAPIPALALLGGPVPDGVLLMLWVFSVSVLGVAIAALLHARFIQGGSLPFPEGTAAAETLGSIHGDGRDARSRLRWLGLAAVISASVKLLGDLFSVTLRASLPGGLPTASFKQLGIALDGSLLMIGFGAIIGLRAGLSLLLGALIAWLGLAPWLLGQGLVSPGATDAVWFNELVGWLIWPGVTLMTTGALASLWLGRRSAAVAGTATKRRFPLPKAVFATGTLAAVALVVGLQMQLFGIHFAVALAAVGMALGLAIVAARVVGETGIPPIGALGKIAQLGVGALAPGTATANLMGANVTGGAAGQTGDLLNDLKAGALLGARPAPQFVAQIFGVIIGSIVGSLSYGLLIPDPATMLLTPEWPAPAVATWKAVAEVMAGGLAALPQLSVPAAAAGGVAGLALALWQFRAPARFARWAPSAAAMGLAFVIPAWIAFGLCLGAVLAEALKRVAPHWALRHVIAVAAGLVGGESLAGVATALATMLA